MYFILELENVKFFTCDDHLELDWYYFIKFISYHQLVSFRELPGPFGTLENSIELLGTY